MRVPLLLLSICGVVWCHPPHPAVVAVRRAEERLPAHLRSPALHNPHLQEVLPLASLLHKGENLVFQREADNVSRQEIYNMLTHAGFLPRRPGFYRPSSHDHRHGGHRPTSHDHGHGGNRPIHHYPQRPAHHHDELSDNFFDPALFQNPELLQHL